MVGRRVGGKWFGSLERRCRPDTRQPVCDAVVSVLAEIEAVVLTDGQQNFAEHKRNQAQDNRIAGLHLKGCYDQNEMIIHLKFFVGLKVFYTFEARGSVGTLNNCGTTGTTL